MSEEPKPDSPPAPEPEQEPAQKPPLPLKEAADALAATAGGPPEDAEREEEDFPDTVPADHDEPEFEEVDAATIDAPEDEGDDTPYEKLVSRAKRLSPERIRTILEALLLVTDRPLGDEAIQLCTGLEVAVIREQMGKLQGKLRDGISGMVLSEVAGGWQLRTDASAAEYVRRFLKVKPQRLTRPALETLAIIAYRQPVTRPEVEEIRAVDCGAVIKALLDRKLIKIIGKKEEVGRPLLYGTTKEFLEFFNLKDLSSLPTLREFHELTEEHREIVETETGAPTAEGTVAALRDTDFEKRLAQKNAEGEAALEELETAMAAAEVTTKQAVQVLSPQAPAAAPGTEPAPGAPAPEAAPAPAPGEASAVAPAAPAAPAEGAPAAPSEKKPRKPRKKDAAPGAEAAGPAAPGPAPEAPPAAEPSAEAAPAAEASPQPVKPRVRKKAAPAAPAEAPPAAPAEPPAAPEVPPGAAEEKKPE